MEGSPPESGEKSPDGAEEEGDVEPDVEETKNNPNCWASSSSNSNREPSNFSQPWYQRRGFNSSQNHRQDLLPQGAEALNDDLVGDLASALERVGGVLEQCQESVNARAHSLPPPINKQHPNGSSSNSGPQNRSRSPPPRRNTMQF